MSKIPFTFQCPGYFQRTCDNKDPVNWVHESCSTRVYIDTEGDLFCDKGCYVPSYRRFIQYWRFSCRYHQGQYFQFATLSDLCNALGNASTAVNSYYSGNKAAINAFYKKLSARISQNWEH